MRTLAAFAVQSVGFAAWAQDGPAVAIASGQLRAARAYLDLTPAGPVAREGLRREACDLFLENIKRH